MSYMRLSQGQILGGNDYSGSYTLGNGQMAGQRFIARPGKSVSGVILRQNAAANGCNFDVLLCPDSAGIPDVANPLSSVLAITAYPSGGGIHEVDFPSPVALTYPNRYWIVARNNTSVNFVTWVYRNSASFHEGVFQTVRQYTTSWQAQGNNRWGCMIKYSDNTFQGECCDWAGAGPGCFHSHAGNFLEMGVEIICPETHGYNVTALVATTVNLNTQPDITPKVYINQQLVHVGPAMPPAALLANAPNRFELGKTISIPPGSRGHILLASPDGIGNNGIRIYKGDVCTFARPEIMAHFGIDRYRPAQRTQSGFAAHTATMQYCDTILDGKNPFVFPDLNRRQFNSMR